MLSNLVRLYAMVFPPRDEEAAQRLAAFLIVSYLDEEWLAMQYFGGKPSERPSCLEPVKDEILAMLGSDAADIRRLCNLCGVAAL